MDMSLHELIATSMTGDCVLPEGFSLPDEDETKKVPFVDGALDGIALYHTAPEQLTDEKKKELGDIIMLASTGAFDEAESKFKEFSKEHRTLTIIDDLQQFIVKNEDINLDNIYEFAVGLLLDSQSKECVKLGLSIMELFEAYENETLAGVIRRLALSDEFTLFSLFNFRQWPAGDFEIFEIAKRVKGWGRIHCVDFIESDDEEIKEWLFFNGVDNDILPAYSALQVYAKADVAAILEKPSLTYDEVHALLKLTDALLDEGPVMGISAIDNPKRYLNKVLLKAKNVENLLSEDDIQIIKIIEDWNLSQDEE